MTTLDHPTLHKEHQEAECEHVMWLEDIGRWRAEHRRAAAMLAQVQAAFLEQDAALEAHAETVRTHELRVQRYERGGSEVDHDKLADSHQELQAAHDQAREAHQRIKTHHGMVTGEIRRLLKKINDPM
jgi:hypothetical protein